MRTKSVLCCLILLTSLRLNLAEEKIAISLPKDGAWARYHVTTTRAEDAGVEPETRKETIRFVGTVESNGQRHRWIEQSFGLKDGRTNVMKTLVAEKDLKSAWPLAAERRWHHKAGDQLATECETLGPEYGVFSLVFPGPYNTAKPLHETRVLDYQRGRLEIKEGLAGRQEVSFQDNGQDVAYSMNYTVWRHPDVPLGLAAAKISMRTQENGRLEAGGTYTVEFILEDCGQDAKSVLPQND